MVWNGGKAITKFEFATLLAVHMQELIAFKNQEKSFSSTGIFVNCFRALLLCPVFGAAIIRLYPFVVNFVRFA